MKYCKKYVLIPWDSWNTMNRTPTPPAAEITPSTSSEVNIVAENNCEQHTNKLDVESILIGIPKCYKNRARALLHFIADSPSISWDARGQMIVNSQVIESSHLTDLLKDCIHEYKSFTPRGVQEFYTALQQNPVPLSLITNLSRRRFLQQGQGTDQIPPPGRPAQWFDAWKTF